MDTFLADREAKAVARFLTELSEGIEKDEELTRIAEHITFTGLHMHWLGIANEDKKTAEVGEQFYKLGGDLQAIALIRMKKRGEIV